MLSLFVSPILTVVVLIVFSETGPNIFCIARVLLVSTRERLTTFALKQEESTYGESLPIGLTASLARESSMFVSIVLV